MPIKGHRFGHGFLQYENDESASFVLRKRYHRIEKYIVTVTMVTDTNTERDDPTCLMDLDDNYWLEVFGKLDINSLHSVANTCTRFKKLAYQTFSKHVHCKIISGEITDDTIKRFATFGKMMDRVEINLWDDSQQKRAFDIITKYCGNKLRVLKLANKAPASNKIPLDNDTKMKLKALFFHLTELHIDHNMLFGEETTKELMSSCSNLTALHLHNIHSDYAWNKLDIKLPNLKKLRITWCSFINDAGLHCLLFNNPTIKSLKLENCNNLSPNAFHQLIKYVPQMDDISLNLFERNIGPGTHELLKTLRIHHLQSKIKRLKKDLSIICKGNAHAVPGEKCKYKFK